MGIQKPKYKNLSELFQIEKSSWTGSSFQKDWTCPQTGTWEIQLVSVNIDTASIWYFSDITKTPVVGQFYFSGTADDAIGVRKHIYIESGDVLRAVMTASSVNANDMATFSLRFIG